MIAFLEVVICSDFLTQFALGGTLSVFGFKPYLHGRLSVAYVVGLSLADAFLLVALILFCSTRTASARARCCSAGGR